MKNRYTALCVGIALVCILPVVRWQFVPAGWLVILPALMPLGRLRRAFVSARLWGLLTMIFTLAGWWIAYTVPLAVIRAGTCVCFCLFFCRIRCALQPPGGQADPGATGILVRSLWFLLALECLGALLSIVLLLLLGKGEGNISAPSSALRTAGVAIRWLRLLPAAGFLAGLSRSGRLPLEEDPGSPGAADAMNIRQGVLLIFTLLVFGLLAVTGLAAGLLALFLFVPFASVALSALAGAFYFWHRGGWTAFFCSVGSALLISILFGAEAVSLSSLPDPDWIRIFLFQCAFSTGSTMLLYLFFRSLATK